MSWHYKFYADTKNEIRDGLNAHLGTINQNFVCSLTTEMLEAVNTLTDDQDGIGWIVECFGHVGTTRESACNFSFKVEPINTLKNPFYRRKSGEQSLPVWVECLTTESAFHLLGKMRGNEADHCES